MRNRNANAAPPEPVSDGREAAELAGPSPEPIVLKWHPTMTHAQYRAIVLAWLAMRGISISDTRTADDGMAGKDGRHANDIVNAMRSVGGPLPAVLDRSTLNGAPIYPGVVINVRETPRPRTPEGAHAATCGARGGCGVYERGGDLHWRCCDALYKRRDEREDLARPHVRST
jgi:hypothetical protein